MPRCVQSLEGEVSYFKEAAIAQWDGSGQAMGPFALPIHATFFGNINLHCRIGCDELARAADEVCMDMGLGYSCDSQAFLRGDFQVAVDVALRVDDNRFAGPLAADNVCVLREVRVENLS